MYFKKSYIFLFIFFLGTGCGDNELVTSDAVLQAEIFLTRGECTQAINVLEGVGRQVTNSNYLIALASSYACRAGYNTPDYFANDLPKMGSPAALGGFARFSTSDSVTEVGSDSFEDILTAVNILLYAGGISASKNPTAARRALIFPADEIKEMRALMMYLLTVHLGQYLYFYGNGSNITGIKGTRVPGSNGCLANYSDVAFANAAGFPATNPAGIDAFLDDVNYPTGTCSSASSGHLDLGLAGSLNVARMCQGAMALNNLRAILSDFLSDVSGSADLGVFSSSGISTLLDTAYQNMAVVQPSTATLSGTLSQTICEENHEVSTSNLEHFFVLLLEVLFV